MYWDKLRVFYYVAKLGSLTKAGEHLNISHSSLSRTIALLEHSMKVKLFLRRPRGLVLTKEGEILYLTTNRMIHEIDATQKLIREQNNQVGGCFKVATTHALASLWLPAFLTEFTHTYPDYYPEIIAHDKEPDLLIHEVDASIQPFPSKEAGIIQEILATFHMKLYASPQYLEKYGIPLKSTELSKHRLIAIKDEYPFDYFVYCKESERPTTCLKMSSLSGLLEMGKLGNGIIACWQELVSPNDLASGELIPILPDLEGPTIDIYYKYPREFHNLKRVILLKDCLKNALGK